MIEARARGDIKAINSNIIGPDRTLEIPMDDFDGNGILLRPLGDELLDARAIIRYRSICRANSGRWTQRRSLSVCRKRREAGMPLAWQEIARFGKKVVSSGLTSSRFGNISLLQGEKIFITCTGSMLDELDESQVVEVDLTGPCDQDKIASSETCVHRAIYQSTAARPSSILILLMQWPYLCWREMAVEPLDSEGHHLLGRHAHSGRAFRNG